VRQGEDEDQQLIDLGIDQTVDEVEQLLVDESLEEFLLGGQIELPHFGTAEGQPHDVVLQGDHQVVLLAGLQQSDHFSLDHG